MSFSQETTSDAPLKSGRILIKLTMTALLGTALGFWTAALTLGGNFPFGAVKNGPWRTWPTVGGPDVDPYSLAIIARTALIPLGLAEGVSFQASVDSQGQAFAPECDYLISGSFGEAKHWSLAILSPQGQPIYAWDSRGALTSSEILRYGAVPVRVTIAPSARAGNWLASDRNAPFIVMLTLYDISLGASLATINRVKLPKIERIACL